MPHMISAGNAEIADLFSGEKGSPGKFTADLETTCALKRDGDAPIFP